MKGRDERETEKERGVSAPSIRSRSNIKNKAFNNSLVHLRSILYVQMKACQTLFNICRCERPVVCVWGQAVDDPDCSPAERAEPVAFYPVYPTGTENSVPHLSNSGSLTVCLNLIGTCACAFTSRRETRTETLSSNTPHLCVEPIQMCLWMYISWNNLFLCSNVLIKQFFIMYTEVNSTTNIYICVINWL